MSDQVKRFVYLLANGPNGSFKIGSSSDPELRCRVLSLETGKNLKILHTIASERAFTLEKYIHRAFDYRRVKGEWFSLTDDDVRLFVRIGKKAEVDTLPNKIRNMHADATKNTTITREPVALDREIVRKARVIASIEEIGISEALERDLRKAIERRYAAAKDRLLDNHGGEG